MGLKPTENGPPKTWILPHSLWRMPRCQESRLGGPPIVELGPGLCCDRRCSLLFESFDVSPHSYLTCTTGQESDRDFASMIGRCTGKWVYLIENETSTGYRRAVEWISTRRQTLRTVNSGTILPANLISLDSGFCSSSHDGTSVLQ